MVELRLNGLHHHNGVVHHRSDDQHQGEKRQQVYRKSGDIKKCERADERDEDTYQRNKSGTDALQEDIDHDDNENNRFDERLDDVLDGSVEEGLHAHHVFQHETFG